MTKSRSTAPTSPCSRLALGLATTLTICTTARPPSCSLSPSSRVYTAPRGSPLAVLTAMCCPPGCASIRRASVASLARSASGCSFSSSHSMRRSAREARRMHIGPGSSRCKTMRV